MKRFKSQLGYIQNMSIKWYCVSKEIEHTVRIGLVHNRAQISVLWF